MIRPESLTDLQDVQHALQSGVQHEKMAFRPDPSERHDLGSQHLDPPVFCVSGAETRARQERQMKLLHYHARLNIKT